MIIPKECRERLTQTFLGGELDGVREAIENRNGTGVFVSLQTKKKSPASRLLCVNVLVTTRIEADYDDLAPWLEQSFPDLAKRVAASMKSELEIRGLIDWRHPSAGPIAYVVELAMPMSRKEASRRKQIEEGFDLLEVAVGDPYDRLERTLDELRGMEKLRKEESMARVIAQAVEQEIDNAMKHHVDAFTEKVNALKNELRAFEMLAREHAIDAIEKNGIVVPQTIPDDMRVSTADVGTRVHGMVLEILRNKTEQTFTV